MMKFTASFALAAVVCLAAVAEARPRDGKIVIRPDRVTVRAPRGSVLVPVPPVVTAPGTAPVPAVAVVPRRLTARNLAALAAVPPPVIPIPVPGVAVPAVHAAPPVVIQSPAAVVVPQPVPQPIPQPVFSAVRPATRASVVAARPAAVAKPAAVVVHPAPTRPAVSLPVRPVAPAATPLPAADGLQSILVSGEEPAAVQPAAAGVVPADPPIELLPTP